METRSHQFFLPLLEMTRQLVRRLLNFLRHQTEKSCCIIMLYTVSTRDIIKCTYTQYHVGSFLSLRN